MVKKDGIEYPPIQYKIAKVHKDDIGTWQTISNLSYIIAPGGYNPEKTPENADVLLYGITFEHDWWSSGYKTVYFQNYQFWFKSKYPDSHYQIYPHTSLTGLQDQEIHLNTMRGGCKIKRID